jgi:hypothetical protein
MTKKIHSEYLAKKKELEDIVSNNPFDEQRIKLMREKLKAKGMSSYTVDNNSKFGEMLRETEAGVKQFNEVTNMQNELLGFETEELDIMRKETVQGRD